MQAQGRCVQCQQQQQHRVVGGTVARPGRAVSQPAAVRLLRLPASGTGGLYGDVTSAGRAAAAAATAAGGRQQALLPFWAATPREAAAQAASPPPRGAPVRRRMVAVDKDGSGFNLDDDEGPQPRRQRGGRGVAAAGAADEADDALEQPPESGVLPEAADRLSSNSSASSSSRHSSSSSSSGLGLGSNAGLRAQHTHSSSGESGGGGGSKQRSNSRSSWPAGSTANSAADTTAGAGGAGDATAAAGGLPVAEAAGAGPDGRAAPGSGGAAGARRGGPGSRVGARALYPPAERSQIQESWDTLMRWSASFRRQQASAVSPVDAAHKVVVFGGGSFGTAMGSSLALKKAELDVVLLLRDPYLCHDINSRHVNSKYLPDFTLPRNVRATTDAAEAVAGASYAVHAVPVQHSRAFLAGIRDVLAKDVPIICVSKGLEVGSGAMMSEVIPSALGRRQPAVFLSGPSFAKEVMQGRPTGVVAACKDMHLGRQVQELFASPSMRVNTSTDVTGVEICGALKNVLAIAAGIVEGLDLGHNALAALIAQGCAEIRWLSQKVGAKPATIAGLSGLGDIMLTCYGDLSRNRSVGIRLGRGERLEDILASSSQVAEGVATAGVVVTLARRYRVSLPVLTAVAQVLDNNLTPAQAVTAVMNLPQIEER